MTPLMHRNDGHITIEGGPCAGETVYVDDAALFLRSDRGRGYVFDPPSYRHPDGSNAEGAVRYQPARIYHSPKVEQLQRGETNA